MSRTIRRCTASRTLDPSHQDGGQRAYATICPECGRVVEVSAAGILRLHTVRETVPANEGPPALRNLLQF